MITRRSAGVLLSISSLPGPFGLGCFGEEAKDWIDRLADMGFSVWQVLPFNIPDAGNSPYGSCSAFAGDPMYIDPRGLLKKGWVTPADVQNCVYAGSPYTADHAFAYRTRMALLHTAFANGGKETRCMAADFESSHGWAGDFALFMAAREANNNTQWWQWDGEYAVYERCVRLQANMSDAKAFWLFVQAVFEEQWREIREYAVSKRVRVLGDMPIYVAMDSADVWSRRELFCLDRQTFRPDKVAGVPPDYFSADGQLWGNPLYDWDAMRQDGYRWWCDRLRTALSLYDSVRIDHFRAFASYWAVPADAATAKEGAWEKGPGMALFDAMQRALAPNGGLPIVAEDLGTYGEDVVQLLHDSGFPGMRVIQFGFDPGSDSVHLPHRYPANTVAYIGTHDNNTLLGWLWEASEEQRRFALDYCGFHGDNWGEGGYHSPSCRAIIETVWKSAAGLSVIPFQDMCGFGSDARMNIPGVPEKNWRFRTTRETMDAMDAAYFRKINRLFSR